MNNKWIILHVTSLALGTSVAFAANTMTKKATEVSQEHSAQKTTADSQMKGSEADVNVIRKIRDRLTDMDDLSTRAQNVTIVTQGKEVTLKGEVDKQEEIQKIMNVAQEEASGKNIKNQLSVHK
jgi:osmotically-inducible protein OsmY